MKNSLGREIPKKIDGYKDVIPFSKAIKSGKSASDRKVLGSIREAIEKVGLKDGMTISFHHHLRNGDYVLNAVLEEISGMGIRDLRIAPSGVFPCHSPIVDHIRSGVITGLETNYMIGPVAKAISQGLLGAPAILRSHGGRARAIESGELHVDVAFIAAPTADIYGNIN